ncbi:MAG: hypothetical protein JXB35_02125 [Anaerolineae bacterium]|nr:hypothetical protein [Anaerolineae bacterium]
MNTNLRASLITVLLIVAITTPVLAADRDWGESDVIDPVNLSNSGDVRQPAMALGPGNQIAVAWSEVGDADIVGSQAGIRIAVGAGQPGTPPLYTYLTGTEDVWGPDITYNGSQLLAAWVQGEYDNPIAPYGVLIQKDVGSANPPLVVMDPVLGFTNPCIAAASNGIHMVFSTAISPTWSQGNLYYAYRATGTNTWETPEIVVTSGQVTPPVGGVWLPHIALSADGQTMHIVWEQTDAYSIRSVWYIRGTWSAAPQKFSWGTPVRLSPLGTIAVRPKVALGAADVVHVTWVEQVTIPGIDRKQQYINYRGLDQGAWSEAIYLDNEAVQVNSYRPTWSTIGIVAKDTLLCVGWHGYRGVPGAIGEEEILLRCSNNNGLSWSGVSTNVSGSPNHLSLFPKLQIDDNEILHVAWEEHQGGALYTTNYDTFFRHGSLPQGRVYLPMLFKSFS